VPAFKDGLTDPEEKLGADIVMKALRAPARIIAENAGVEGEVIINKVLGQPFSIGYNAMVDKVRSPCWPLAGSSSTRAWMLWHASALLPAEPLLACALACVCGTPLCPDAARSRARAACRPGRTPRPARPPHCCRWRTCWRRA